MTPPPGNGPNGGSDTKGDDNKNSANPRDINDLGDDIGERVGKTDHKPHESTL